MARPSKLTKEIQNQIVVAVRAGNYMETAAAFAGISKDTFYKWLKRGARERQRLDDSTNAKPRKKELPFLEFSDAVTRAISEAEVRDVQNISKAGEAGDWRASAWRLARRHPERWGNTEKVQANVNHSGEVVDRHEQHTKVEVVHRFKQYTDAIDELLHEEEEQTSTLGRDRF